MKIVDRIDRYLESIYLPASFLGIGAMTVCIFKMFKYRKTGKIEDVISWQKKRLLIQGSLILLISHGVGGARSLDLANIMYKHSGIHGSVAIANNMALQEKKETMEI